MCSSFYFIYVFISLCVQNPIVTYYYAHNTIIIHKISSRTVEILISFNLLSL